MSTDAPGPGGSTTTTTQPPTTTDPPTTTQPPLSLVVRELAMGQNHLKIKRSSTSIIWQVFIADASENDGRGLTGLGHQSAGLVANYSRDDDATPTSITLVSAIPGTYTSGGFVEISAASMPGWYQLHIPNAAWTGNHSVAVQLRGATDMVVVNLFAEIDSVDYQDEEAFGLKDITRSIVKGVVAASSTTTLVKTSSLSPSVSDTDQFLNRVLIFDSDTTTSGLRGQPTRITGVATNGDISVEELTRAPSVGDTFIIV